MGGSIFFFVESKTLKFSVEEGVLFTCYVFTLYVVVMAKESVKHSLAIVEGLMSNVSAGKLTRTFRDGDKVFILQLGSNAYGSFFMISELIHGRWKGFIVVPEGKLGSGWRGFGFHLRKAIAAETLAIKLSSQSVLKPTIVEQCRQRDTKTHMLVMVEGCRREDGGGNKRKQLIPNFQNLKNILSSQNQDFRERNARKEKANIGAKILLIIYGIVSNDTEEGLILDVSFKMERDLDGKWKVKWSRVHQVGPTLLKPMAPQFKPTNAYPYKPNPKPISAWRPKRYQPCNTSCAPITMFPFIINLSLKSRALSYVSRQAPSWVLWCLRVQMQNMGLSRHQDGESGVYEYRCSKMGLNKHQDGSPGVFEFRCSGG